MKSSSMARFPLIPLTEAAKRKRVAPKTLWVHAKRGTFDTVQLAGRILIVDNERWRAWQPDRVRQKAILRGLRKRGR